MIDKLIIDIKNNLVFDDKGNDLGRTGDTKLEIDHDKAMVYLQVNTIIPAANFRRIADSLSNPKQVERKIKL